MRTGIVTTRHASPVGGKVKKSVCMYCGKAFTQAKRKLIPVCPNYKCGEDLESDRVKRSYDLKKKR